VSTPNEGKPEADRRASLRRTVWTLALIAGAIYGYFIVKTFMAHAGGAA
jgi:uncharacterized membrane protein YoaK (UPF0700 family)